DRRSGQAVGPRHHGPAAAAEPRDGPHDHHGHPRPAHHRVCQPQRPARQGPAGRRRRHRNRNRPPGGPRMNPTNLPKYVPYILKQVWRHRVRTLLTVIGIAIAMFLFTSVQAMQQGVTQVTKATASDTTLVVYRKDRFCPATSELPQDYQARIERIEGVVAAIP